MLDFPIVIFADAQANLHAMQALFKYCDQHHIKSMINLGDLVSVGPNPEETVQLLKTKATKEDYNIINIIGNHDEVACLPLEDYFHSFKVKGKKQDHERWTFQQLSDDSIAYINTFYRSLDLDQMHLDHYGRRENETFQMLVPFYRFKDPNLVPTAQELDQIFHLNTINKSFSYVLCGHDHFGFDVYSEDSGIRYLNPGALGVNNYGKAPFLLLDNIDQKLTFKKIHIEFDWESVRQTMIKKKAPNYQFILNTYLADSEKSFYEFVNSDKA